MKRTPLLLLTLLASVSGGCSGRRESSPELAELEALPVGMEVIHTPATVGDPEGPNRDPSDWPYRWHFDTEVRALDRPITIIRFGIIAWDGSRWVLPPDQRDYNAGVLDKETFADWFDCPNGVIKPGRPALNKGNWAGAHQRAPFRQKWFFIGEDAEGRRYKGEGVVNFVTKE